MNIRTCHKCFVTQNENEFHNFTSKRLQHICKTCDRFYPSRIELYTCEICGGITIRKKYKKRYEKTRTHLRSKITGETNIRKNLGSSVLRKIKKKLKNGNNHVEARGYNSTTSKINSFSCFPKGKQM